MEQIAELRKENEEQKADIHRYLNELIPELIKATIEEGKKSKETLTLCMYAKNKRNDRNSY